MGYLEEGKQMLEEGHRQQEGGSPDGAIACYTKAISLYSQANNVEGVGEAYRCRGIIYHVDVNDDDKAIADFKMAADYGDTDALWALKEWLEIVYTPTPRVLSGQSSSDDNIPFMQEAKQGDVIAQSRVALNYFMGKGVPQNSAKAFEWATKAAAQGDAASCQIIAFLYESGDSVPCDYAKAAEWYRKAIDRGMTGAQQYLDKLKSEGKI